MSSEPTRRQQHLVSNGYQRNFADGSAVSVIEVSTGAVVSARRSTKKNWRAEDFLSVVADGVIDDKLEKEFARDELVVLNSVRDIDPSQKVSPQQKKSLDRLAAIHLVRSMTFRDEHHELVQNWLPTGVAELASSAEVQDRFEKEQGSLHNAGDLHDFVATRAAEFAASPDLLPNSIRRSSRKIDQLLAKWSIQLVDVNAALPGLVLADNPVLHGKRKVGQFGFRNAGAVGDADIIIVPIHRHLAALYSGKKLRTVTIGTKEGVNWINSLLLRGASQEVICHPEDAQNTTRLIRNLSRYPASKFDGATLR